MSRPRSFEKFNQLILVGALALPCVPAAAADAVTVNVSGFSKTDGEKVKQSVGIILNRWLSAKIADCIYDNVTRRWDSIEQDETALTKDDLKSGGLYLFVTHTLSPAGIRWKKSKFTLNVKGTNLGNNINGQAVLRDPGLKNNPPQFNVVLNTVNVGDRSAEQLAGTVFHEMLHNVGETHGSVADYDKAYKGFLIKEWGHCIAGNGVPNFGLAGDPYASWDE